MPRNARFTQGVWILGLAVAVLAGPRLAIPAVAQCPYDWLPGEGIPGVNGEVHAITSWDPDGPGPQSEVLVVGGEFTITGAVSVNNIAVWDPKTSTWSALGAGIGTWRPLQFDPHVNALAVLNGRLYAGGYFTSAGGTIANNVACWDPDTQTWSALGSGIHSFDSSVSALAVLDTKLYVGGSFLSAGEVWASGIACWDPETSTWSTLKSGVSPGGGVYALTTMDGKLYAGGLFGGAGGVPAAFTACWDPATSCWSGLGSGTNGWVYALTVWEDKLYAGGSFSTAGGTQAKSIACWDPTAVTWSALGSKLSGGDSPEVSGVAVLDGKVYAGGRFTTAGGVGASNIAWWDPGTSVWSSLGAGVSGYVWVLTSLNDTLYVGGNFGTAGGRVSVDLARWGPVRAPDDYDCDGVTDASDNCPQIENADQADADSDGIGDVCDVCPNDPLNDADGDGICGDVDNCPKVGNADQADADADGVGDVCDVCEGSDLAATIVIDGLDTGVPNKPLGNGCTMSDEIAKLAAVARNHGGFVSSLTALTKDWVRQGLMTTEERDRAIDAAARSRIGRGLR